ncbi:MAG: hypothetical protein NZZ60_00290 [Bacteroidia bacterium]|nr:hypothetical protein [Bacteroidia bacterium]MCX7651754.1 hypothetical protein [Bacteroidia bacterium]MDW8416374.1 hypothetical protein [Bacteroidia bacterium]
MGSTKRYYTLAEVAEMLHVPVYQARRWARLFLSLPPHKMMRIPAESLPILRKVREGAILYRLRGEGLKAFVEGKAPPSGPPPIYPDYPTLLGEILREIDELLRSLEE